MTYPRFYDLRNPSVEYAGHVMEPEVIDLTHREEIDPPLPTAVAPLPLAAQEMDWMSTNPDRTGARNSEWWANAWGRMSWDTPATDILSEMGEAGVLQRTSNAQDIVFQGSWGSYTATLSNSRLMPEVPTSTLGATTPVPPPLALRPLPGDPWLRRVVQRVTAHTCTPYISLWILLSVANPLMRSHN